MAEEIKIIKSYCEVVAQMDNPNVHLSYHDNEYGFPLQNDNELFGRLILEINQAGLSWTTILNKKENFRKAYANFDVKKISRFNQKDKERLLGDAGIIRNKLKVNAAVFNAQKVIELQNNYGSFKGWLNKNHPKTREEWVKLFKQTFKFTGGEITNEFLISTGYLKGAHDPDCPIYKKVLLKKPKWSE